jgi:hypothetical protein
VCVLGGVRGRAPPPPPPPLIGSCLRPLHPHTLTLPPSTFQWDTDEGANTTCFESAIAEKHNTSTQTLEWRIEM